MLLPNRDLAIVDLRKLQDYCLSSDHPRGRHKARVFLNALDLSSEDADWLADRLRFAAQNFQVAEGISDEFGDRFIIDFDITRGRKSAQVRSCWIVLREEKIPRFVSCYVL